MVCPFQHRRLFGNRHHPQRRELYTSSQNCQRFFVTDLTKNRAARTPVDSPVSTPLYFPTCLHKDISGQVAQLVEHVTENHGVGGSTPSLAINQIKHLRAAPKAARFALCAYSVPILLK